MFVHMLTDGGPGAAGFPVTAATAVSVYTGGTTTKTVDLPAGIQSGDLLLVCFRCHNSNNALTTPSGWTLLDSRSSAGAGAIYYRVADGSEGSTLSVVSSTTGDSAHVAFRITGYRGIPEGLFVAASSKDPPAVAPSWGSAQTLFIAGISSSGQNADTQVIRAPANDGDLQQIGSGGSTSSVSMATVRRKLAAAKSDPKAFICKATNGMAFTIAIRPA
ncbi:hypothetical protein [Mesorhizobium sp. M0037]|uniref:hypothetical protein n=1 Tax=unclassified Mesorhizobium TaxID=325217 RepID=UPI00333556C8